MGNSPFNDEPRIEPLEETQDMAADKMILLVEDDEALRVSLVDLLKLHEDFETVAVDTGSAAMEAVRQKRFDLLILDVGLPDMDGRELCRLMRRNDVKAPILMLTGADSEADTILGLDAGANDYIAKPFKLGVLLARIRAQLRQYERSEDAVFSLGPYSFRPAAKMLLDADGVRKIRLTEKESAILKYLFRAGDMVIGRDELLNEVWGYNSRITTHTLETHVYRLRQKLEADPSNARILVTEPGGYRLIP